MTESVFQLLREAAADQPESPAVTFEDEELSWAELESLTRRTASGLEEIGVGKGDRVAFWLPNTTAYVALYFACAQLGACTVAVNTRFRAKEAGDILHRSRASVLVLWPDFRGIDFIGVLQDVPEEALTELQTIVTYGAAGTRSSMPHTLGRKTIVDFTDLIGGQPREPDDGAPGIACNMFTTSGTTSAPKFVVHHHSSIVAHAHELRQDMAELIGAGALLQTLPFCGVFGFTSLVLAVAARTKMVVTSAFDPAESIRLVDKHNVRYLNVTDDMLMAMLAADNRNRALPSLVCCGFGAFNASPEEIAERAEARGVKLVGLYGMSEVLALFARRRPEDDDAARILGGGKLVSPTAYVRVRDPDTGEICAHSTEGEIEIKGPSLMAEYLENEAATREAFTSDGYLRTGDMGYTTGPKEFVYLTRMGDTLRLGGFLVSPVEIEAHLTEHASIAGAQVVSVRIADTTRAFAFVLLAEGYTLDDELLSAHCRDALARFKVPVGFQALSEFPTTKSANGTKIQRAKLRDMAQRLIDESMP